MKIEDPNEILEWDTEKLWNAVQQIKEEIEKQPRGYEQAKNGIKIKFPIQYIINQWYDMYPSTKNARILGYGKTNIQNLLDEIEERNSIMRKIIIEHTDNEEATKPRIE